MSHFTPNYKLYSGDAGEATNPLEDSRRFLTIDRQLLGLFQVFGNGVIEGWDVTQSGDLAVSISPGRGHVNFMAGVTTDPRTVVALTPNATNYIYAQAIEQTRFNRDVRFFADTTLFNSGSMILLAAVTTGPSSITSIDSSVRNDISFIAEIKALINQHRHRGGPDNPTKIDLQSEVIGQLPSFRVDGIDASQIISGRLDPARIPPLEHGELLNSGVITHPQIDSFIRNLSNPNTRLTGELAAGNMMQLWMALKHIWHDCDAFTTNQIVMIPGITPDTQTDFVATTATFDRANHLIQGVPSLAGSLLTTSFRTETNFLQSFLRVNIDVTADSFQNAIFQLTMPQSTTIVESFDNVFTNATDVPGWTLETVSSNDNSKFQTDSTEKDDGAFSAKLSLDQSFRVQVTKLFAKPVDWTGFNELELSIETLASDHGQIRFQILTGQVNSFEVLDDFQVLTANEITTGFLRVVRDLTSLTRNAIIGIRIYTDTALGWDLAPFAVNVDRIRINNNLFFSGSGLIRFRFQTPQKSQWAAISWDGDLNGGIIQARARTAPTFALFDQSSAVPFLPFITTPGDDPKVSDNTNIEVEIALAPNPGKTASPVVRSVTLSYITQSQSTGLTVDNTTQFLRAAKLVNVRVDDPGQATINGRIDVGDYTYGQMHSIQQVDRFGTPVVGITGTRLPLSPIQASRTDFILRQSSIDGAAAVQRLPDRSYLVADTLNDRVVIFDRAGNLVQGLASNNARNVTGLYPLTATYNRAARTLYVCWSTNVTFKTVDLTKFTVNGAGLVVVLSAQDTIVTVQGPNTQNDSGNVTAILLSDAHAGELATFFDSQSTSDPRIFLDVKPSAVKATVNTDNLNFATLTGPRGLPVFVGNLTFISGIYQPVDVSLTSVGTWLISNAKPLTTNSDGSDVLTGVGKSEVSSVIEVDPATGLTSFSDNSVDFSLLTLGAAIEYSPDYIAVAGIQTDQSPPSNTSNSTVTTAALGAGTTTQTASTTTSTASSTTSTGSTNTTTTTTSITDFSQLSKFRGRVKIVEKASGSVVYDQPTSDGTYAADVRIDADQNLVVVEKSFDGTTGRGRVLKLDEDGNVFFQFGLAELASPNDARVLSTGNLVIST